MSTLILLSITVAEVASIFTDPDTRIKGVQIGYHEIKQWIFLRGINCLTTVQVILKL